MNVKGASIVVWVNEAGEVIEAKKAHKETGEPIGDIDYGQDEIAKNKKIVGGTYKTRLMYPNTCCWKQAQGNGWVCQPC